MPALGTAPHEDDSRPGCAGLPTPAISGDLWGWSLHRGPVVALGAARVILFKVAYGVMNARKTRILAANAMGASPLRERPMSWCWKRKP